MRRTAEASFPGSTFGIGKLTGLLVLAVAATLAVAVSSASAAPPTATIDPTVTAGYTTAQVSGTVDPADQETYYSFEYSADPATEGWSPFSYLGPIAAGAGVQNVSTELTGLKTGTEYQVRLAAMNFAEFVEVFSAQPDATFTTEAVIVPTVSLDPVTTITSTTAHFSGAIDPNAAVGNPPVSNVSWHFQCTPECPGLDGGEISADNTPHQVSVDATNLQPNTSYGVKLVATNMGGSEVSAGPDTFITLRIPPTITTVVGVSDGEGGYFLSGGVNPHNSPVTSCTFEYGPTTSYGQSIPCDLNPADGDRPVLVNAHPTGLTPEATYHFRLSASNSAGPALGADGTFVPTLASSEACPNEAIRQEQDTTFLADCRAYEMVSPPFKGGFDVEGVATLSDDGGTMSFNSAGGFAGSKQGHGINVYRSIRGSSGWLTEGTAMSPSELILTGGSFADTTSDLKSELFLAHRPSEVTNAANFYLRRPDGQITAVGPTQPPGKIAATNYGTYRGGSADLSHVLFTVGDQLLPADTGSGIFHLYEYSGAGTSTPILHLVGVDNQGVLIGGCSTYLGSNGQASHAVSSDGSTVFFTAEACGGAPAADEVYARINGQETLPLSVSQCTRVAPETTCNGPAPACYQGASKDGSVAFFTTSQQLLNEDTDSGNDLYRYDLSGSGLSRITVPAAGESAEVQGVEAISEDGSLVYFVARGVLASNSGAMGLSATAGANNFYVWNRNAGGTDGQVKFIAQLPEQDATFWTEFSQAPHQSYPTSSGLVFATYGQLTANDTDASADIYSYSVDGGALQRDSIGSPKLDGSGNGPFDASFSRNNLNAFAQPVDRKVSADGQYIYFQSAEVLASADENAVEDVYEFHNGIVTLISGGETESLGAEFRGTTPSGRDAFFRTKDSLLPEDIDSGNADIYDARAEGGFAQPPLPAHCEVERCQASATTPPPSQVAVTVAFSGPGNSRAAGSVKASRPRTVEGKSTTLRVRVPGKGRISVVGSSVRRASKNVGKAGSYPLKIKLTGSAARQLSRHQVKTTVQVTFVPEGDVGVSTTEVQLLFRNAAANKRSSDRRVNVPSTTSRKGR